MSESYPLHLNAMESDVLMLLSRGKKKMAAFPPSEGPKLGPLNLGGTQMFVADALNDGRSVIQRGAHGFITEIEAGELLFMPGDFVHQFVNVANTQGEDTFALVWQLEAFSKT